MNQLPDYRIIQLEVARDDARGAAEVKELALINAAAFLEYVRPFVPAHLWVEYMRTVNDIDWARGIAA